MIFFPVVLVGGLNKKEGNVFAYNPTTQVLGGVCDDRWSLKSVRNFFPKLRSRNAPFTGKYHIPSTSKIDRFTCFKGIILVDLKEMAISKLVLQEVGGTLNKGVAYRSLGVSV